VWQNFSRPESRVLHATLSNNDFFGEASLFGGGASARDEGEEEGEEGEASCGGRSRASSHPSLTAQSSGAGSGGGGGGGGGGGSGGGGGGGGGGDGAAALPCWSTPFTAATGRATHTVQCASYCEMLVLNKEDMLTAAHGRESRHMAYRQALREGARRRCDERSLRQSKSRIGLRRLSGGAFAATQRRLSNIRSVSNFSGRLSGSSLAHSTATSRTSAGPAGPAARGGGDRMWEAVKAVITRERAAQPPAAADEELSSTSGTAGRRFSAAV